jgi:hypothetical protein
MMAKDLELLQTSFNLRLYGRPIQGVDIDRERLNRRIRQGSEVRALKQAVSSLHALASEAKADDMVPLRGLREAVAPVYEVDRGLGNLARIYAYVQGTRRVVLPRPIALLVEDESADAWGWDELFPARDKAYRCWEVDPQEVTLRFDTRQGTFEELLLRPEPLDQPAPDVSEPEGGILIRGADNRLYLIPLGLEPFEVRDETEKSRLLIEAPSGQEIKVDSLRLLRGRSTLVARSTLTVRSTLTLRSTLAAAANGQ